MNLNQMEVLTELNKFNILFLDDGHIYIHPKGHRLTSVTTILGKFKKPFNTEYHSARVARRKKSSGFTFNMNEPPPKVTKVTAKSIQKDWKYEADIGKLRGSIHHNYMENKIANKIIPNRLSLEVVKEEDYVEFMRSINILENLGYNFLDFNKHLIPIKSELVVGNNIIAGQVDQLYYNTRVNEYQIWDWKTDKKFNNISPYNEKLINGLNHLDNCELNKYSLQLALYKYLIQTNTNIRLGTNHIVWFNWRENNYTIVPLPNMNKEIKIICKKIKELL